MHHGDRTSPGHDIPPNEERLNDHTMEGISNGSMTPVDVISSYHETENGEIEVEYERVFVHRPLDRIYQEPLDQTPPTPIGAESETLMYGIENGFGSYASSSGSNPAGNMEFIRKMYSERARLATFEGKWSSTYAVHPRDLARNALFYLGPGDKVKCVFCRRTLSGWEAGDVVEQEHKKHYPDCPFVLGRCERINVPFNSPETMQHSYGVKVRKSEMTDIANRLASFDSGWPASAPVQPIQLAEAGFFYTGVADKTRCFMCRKMIHRWEKGDDPWSEHVRLYPNCPLVRSHNGKRPEPMHTVPASSTISGMPQEPVGHILDPVSQPPGSVSQPALSNPVEESQGAFRFSSRSEPTSQQLAEGDMEMETEQLSEEMSRLKIDSDMSSPAVQAFRSFFPAIPEDRIRQFIYRLRLSKGPDHKLNVTDLAPLGD